MGVVETVHNIRSRVLLELLAVGLEEEPSPPFHQPTPIGATPAPAPTKIRVLSMNVWGIPVTPYNATERAQAIGAILEEKAKDWDIITLQEVWHRREKRIIVHAALRAGFAYSHYFHPAVGFPLPIGHDSFGTGLLVLSKFPPFIGHVPPVPLDGPAVCAARSRLYLRTRASGSFASTARMAPRWPICT